MTKKFIPLVWRIPLIPLIIFELLVILSVFDITPDFTKIGLLITSSAVLILLELPYRYALLKDSERVLWWAALPAVIAVLFDAAGDFLHLYSRFYFYDTILHFLGAFSSSMFIWQVFTVYYAQKIREHLISIGLIYFMTFTTAITFGVLYEVEEYLEDFFLHSSRLGDGPDTGNDLSMDILGSLTLIALMLWYEQRWKKSPREKLNP